MSLMAWMAKSLRPMTACSPSIFSHSWELVYLRSVGAGKGASLFVFADLGLDKGRFDDLGLDAFASHINENFAAFGAGGQGQIGQADVLGQAGRGRCRSHL